MWGEDGQISVGGLGECPLTVTHAWEQRVRGWVLRHHDSELRAPPHTPGPGQAWPRPTLLFLPLRFCVCSLPDLRPGETWMLSPHPAPGTLGGEAAAMQWEGALLPRAGLGELGTQRVAHVG